MTLSARLREIVELFAKGADVPYEVLLNGLVVRAEELEDEVEQKIAREQYAFDMLGQTERIAKLERRVVDLTISQGRATSERDHWRKVAEGLSAKIAEG